MCKNLSPYVEYKKSDAIGDPSYSIIVVLVVMQDRDKDGLDQKSFKRGLPRLTRIHPRTRNRGLW